MTQSRRLLLANGVVVGEQFEFVLAAPQQLHIVRATQLSTNPAVNQLATDAAEELYRHLQPGQRSCRLTLTVMHPLTREMAEAFEQRRITLAMRSGVAAGAAAKAVAGFVGSAVVGAAVRETVLATIKQRHDGDVIVCVEGEVSGGIGPQHSVRTHVLPRSVYDRDYGF